MSETRTSPAATVSTEQGSDYVSALVASFLGWTLDAFDFFVLVFTIPAIAAEFHTGIPAVAGTIAITLAFRPVGAFIFGLLADRFGRRLPLMLDLVFYSIIEVLSGFAPTFTTFVILRALFGIGMGGEWGVGASLVMEKVPPRWRGILSGLLQEGYAVGYLLAAGCYFFVFPVWGWRAMFFIGGLPALLALFVRYRVKESEVWQNTREKSWGALARAAVSHWKVFLYLTLLMMMMNLASHGTQDMYPTFMKEHRGFGPREVAVIAVIYNIGALLGGIVFGNFSDKFGRRRSMMVALGLAIVMIPLWAFAHGTIGLTVGAFLMQFMVQGAWGVIPAHISELSPDSVRGFLPGFAYQCGVLLAGSIAYLEAVLAQHFSYPTAMAVCALIIFTVGVAVIGAGKERRGVRFGEKQSRAGHGG